MKPITCPVAILALLALACSPITLTPIAHAEEGQQEEQPPEETSHSTSGSIPNYINGPIARVPKTSITFKGCASPVTDYLGRGLANNPEQVKALQLFLNEHMNAGLRVDGIFGPLTEQAVKNFQLKYSGNVLDPWEQYGSITDGTATGFVYKTTLYQIALLSCPDVDISAPLLP